MPSRIRAWLNRQASGRSGRLVASPAASAAARAASTSWPAPLTEAASSELNSVPSTLAAASNQRAPSSRPLDSDQTRWLISALPPAMRATVSVSAAVPGRAARTRASVATYSGLPSERACTNRATSGSAATPAVCRILSTAASPSGASRITCSPGSRARSPSEARQGSPAVSRQVASTSRREAGSSAASSRSRKSEA